MNHWFAAFVYFFFVSHAMASPWVRVRTETRIELHTRVHLGELKIRGALRDDAGQPLQEKVVDIEVVGGETLRVQAKTNAAGEFSEQVRASASPNTPCNVIATYEGDVIYQRASVQQKAVQGEFELWLDLDVPHQGQLDLDQGPYLIHVKARPKTGSAPVEIEIQDELGRTLRRGITQEGHVMFSLHASDFGGIGYGRLLAVAKKSSEHAGAQVEVPILRYRKSFVSLDVTPSYDNAGNRFAIASGELWNPSGPIEGGAIGVFHHAHHFGTVLTNARGQYRLIVPAKDAQSLSLFARFESNRAGQLPAVSILRMVAFRSPPTFPAWGIQLFLLCACAFVMWIFFRRERMQKKRETEVGVETNVRSRKWKRRSVSEISGVVMDRASKMPVLRCEVTCLERDGTSHVLSRSQGRFESGRLKQGSVTVDIRAEGYPPQRYVVDIPHDGAWLHRSVELESTRTWMMLRFKEVAMKILSTSREWPIRTNREVASTNTRPDLILPLRELVELVDAWSYGGLSPSDAELQDFQTRAETLLRHLSHDAPALRRSVR